MLATRRAKAVPFWVQLALRSEIGSPWVVPAKSLHPLSVGLSSPMTFVSPVVSPSETFLLRMKREEGDTAMREGQKKEKSMQHGNAGTLRLEEAFKEIRY